jgi:hypothetical protein
MTCSVGRYPEEEPTATATHRDLPTGTYNGMTFTLLKNVVGNASATMHMIDFGPKPKVYEVELTPIDKDTLRAGGVSRDAVHRLDRNRSRGPETRRIGGDMACP